MIHIFNEETKELLKTFKIKGLLGDYILASREITNKWFRECQNFLARNNDFYGMMYDLKFRRTLQGNEFWSDIYYVNN